VLDVGEDINRGFVSQAAVLPVQYELDFSFLPVSFSRVRYLFYLPHPGEQPKERVVCRVLGGELQLQAHHQWVEEGGHGP